MSGVRGAFRKGKEAVGFDVVDDDVSVGRLLEITYHTFCKVVYPFRIWIYISTLTHAIATSEKKMTSSRVYNTTAICSGKAKVKRAQARSTQQWLDSLLNRDGHNITNLHTPQEPTHSGEDNSHDASKSL